MSDNLKLLDNKSDRQKNKKIPFARYIQDSPIILLLASIVYGIMIYLYYNFRFNPLWGGTKNPISSICTPEDMSGCSVERAIELEEKLQDPSKQPSWWDKNKIHILDIFFSLGASSSFILLLLSWFRLFSYNYDSSSKDLKTKTSTGDFTDDPTFKERIDAQFNYLKIFGPIGLFLLWILLIFGLIAGLVYFITSTPAPLNLLINVITFATIILLITYLWKVADKPSFKDYFKYNTLLGFIYLSIKFIPCKIIDFIDWLKNQYKITSKTDFIILLITLTLAITRIIIPILWNWLRNKIWSQNILLNGSVALQNSKKIGIFQGIDPSKVKHDNCFNYNYSISFKIWINPQGEWTNFKYNSQANILNFGDVLLVTWNKEKMQFIAYTTSETNINTKLVVYSIPISSYPLQRWNDFVINYNGGTLDIFMNGSLESSTPNITPIMGYHSVTVGENDGIYGGIKEVIYYNKMLNINDIRNLSIIS